MMAAGFRSVPGVLIVPLGKEFGWSHALIGGAVSVNLIVYGLGAPFAAAIVERFGVRKVTCRSRSARSRSAPGSRCS